MSRNYTMGPIPVSKFPEFLAHMDAADDDDLPDGAWFAVMEETAAAFMRHNRIKGCENSAAHQWVQSCEPKAASKGGAA